MHLYLMGFNPFDIYGSLLQLIWTIFIQGPLALINVFTLVLNYITGGIITDILFGSSNTFDFGNLPSSFWWFVIVAASVFIIVFGVQIIVIQFKEHTENKTKLVQALYSGCKAFAFMFLIPVFFFIANLCISGLSKAAIAGFSGNGNIAQYLWHLGDPSWDGTANGVPSDFGAPDNIKSYNMMAEIFGTWFMIFAVFMIGLILVQKVIELFFLFIISPAPMICMVLDDGKRAFVWKDMVIAKFLASTATLIGFNIFMAVTQVLLKSDMGSLSSSEFGKQLFIILFLCGGGLATLGFSNIIASLVGEGVGISEGMASMRSTFAGMGFAATGMGMVGKALGFAKGKSGGKRLLGRNNNSAGGIASATQFAQQMAGTDRVMDAGPIKPSPNWAKRGIPGLLFGAVGATVGVGTGMHAARKAGGAKGVFKQVGKGIARPFKWFGNAVNPELVKGTKAQFDKTLRKNNGILQERIDKTMEVKKKFSSTLSNPNANNKQQKKDIKQVLRTEQKLNKLENLQKKIEKSS